MCIAKIDERVYEIDVEAAGVRGLVSSYLLIGEKIVIVETGPASSVPKLMHGLEVLNVKTEDVAYVAISHIHLDHGGGVGTVLKHLPKAKVIVHRKGAPHLASPDKLWQKSKETIGIIAEYFGKPEPVPPEKIVEASEGMSITLNEDFRINVLETPGHASHHLSFYDPFGRRLFVGDAAGFYLKNLGVIIPTTPSPFRLDLALASLERLNGLKPEALYYTHFGVAHDPHEKIKAYVKQLKLWAEIAKESVEGGLSLKEAALKVVDRDEAARKASEYFKNLGVFGENVISVNMKGFIDYFKTYGSSFQI